MKYTDYTPNRSTDQIRADIEMIQSLRPDRKRNKRRLPSLPDWSYTVCHVLALLGMGACVTALIMEIFNH